MMRSTFNSCRRYIAALLLFFVMTPGQALTDGTNTIRLGIISLAPPAKVYKQWQAFADYLSTKTGEQIEIVVPRGFEKIKQAVSGKTVDIFYVNSLIFYLLKQEGKAVALAQMMGLDGKVFSKSVMFVRKDSGINSITDLKGEKVAFVTPLGAGGYLAPRAAFYNAGIKTKTDTTEDFTKNITSSIHKVLLGDVKAGTMCGLNFKLMSERISTGDLKIIATSDEYPENVLGAREDMPLAIRTKLTDAVIGMFDDAEGRKILENMASMKILRFVDYNEKNEMITRKLIKQAEFE